MTKLIRFVLAALAWSSLASCKQDFQIDLSDVIELPPFYVEGTVQSSRQVLPDSFYWDMQPNDFDIVTTGVAAATGSVDGRKYIAAMMGYEPSSWRADAPFVENPTPFKDVYKSMVGVKVISDLPASNVSQPFAKAELEALLRPGMYVYGNGPREVTVDARRITSDLLMQDLIPLQDASGDYFEILAVKDYYSDGARPIAGKAVDFRCRATLRYPYPTPDNLTYYVELKGKLLFEYQ